MKELRTEFNHGGKTFVSNLSKDIIARLIREKCLGLEEVLSKFKLSGTCRFDFEEYAKVVSSPLSIEKAVSNIGDEWSDGKIFKHYITRIK